MMTDCGSRVGQPDSAQWISDDDLNCVEQAITILQGWVEAADREHEIRLTAEHERDELTDRVAALTAERDAADELRQQQHRAKSIVMDSQQREIVGLREQVETLTAERDGLLTDLIHFAQTNHQAHHGDHSGTWLSCDRGSCPGLRRAVSRARGDTTPPAGAQEHEHDWQPAGFTPHPASGGLMPTDQCRVCGAVRYPYSPDVQP